MSVVRLLALGALAILPMCAGVASVAAQGKHPSAEAVRPSLVGGQCGDDLCADVWRFTCPSAATLHADVTDTGLPLTDVLMITLVGDLPGHIRGKASVRTTAPGGSTVEFAEITKPGNGPMSGYAIVVSLTGETAYTVDLHCHEKDGTAVDAKSVTLIQDERPNEDEDPD
jgi:hypothetical protein